MNTWNKFVLMSLLVILLTGCQNSGKAPNTQQELVEYLGGKGYSAVDMKNQINMVNAESVEQFCKKAQENQKAKVSIYIVKDRKSCVRYNLVTDDGEIYVVRNLVEWKNGSMEEEVLDEFKASAWKYTEKGYLFLQRNRPAGYDGEPGEVAIRVKPLEQTCREMNQKYVVPMWEQLFDASYPHAFEEEEPYPEVTAFEEQSDGTIKFEIEAVWVSKMDDCAVQSELVVQSLEDGEFQCLAYRVVDSIEVSKMEQEVMDVMNEYEDLSTIEQMGYPVISDDFYENMRNYEQMEAFLYACEKGTAGEMIFYDVHEQDGITRYQFEFDGTEMYVWATIGIWDENHVPYISEHSYMQVKEWNYTDKGWFSYEYYVPDYPEVTELVIGDVLIRVRPQPEEYRELAEKYLFPLGYQGNNLFCSDWDSEHLESIDYNGLYQYLYKMEYGTEFELSLSEEGIPENEFEKLMTKYLPVTTKQLRKYAVYNEAKHLYDWAELGCGTYAPNSFATSFPEITEIKENKDGSLTLIVDAVCERVGNEAVMSHVVTIRILEDGSVKYLSNQVLEDGLEKIPEYQYRCTK